MIVTRTLRLPVALVLGLLISALPSAASSARSPQVQETPAQDAPGDEGVLEPEVAREYRDRFAQLTALTSDPNGMSSVFDDPVAVEQGQAMLVRLMDAAGGLEAWQALPGLRLDLLETRVVLLNRNRDEWGVHHRVPRLVHFTPEGDGYALSEFTTPAVDAAMFMRSINVGKSAWLEQSGGFQRSPEAIDKARGLLRKEFLLAAMPFSLHAVGADLAFVRKTQRSDKDKQGNIALVPLEVYAVRLRPKQAVRFDEYEWQEQLLVFVETERDKVTQVQYLVFEKDRDSYRTPFNRCYVNLQGKLELEGVRLPRTRVAWHENPIRRDMIVAADPRPESVPPAALRKPWLAGEVWQPVVHADEWDPPGRNILEESREPRQPRRPREPREPGQQR